MNVYDYIVLFFIYSFLGFIIEVIVSLITLKKLVNRGFLIGPYCPIYGIGALTSNILLQGYIDKPIGLFIIAMFWCALIEYSVSFILEKIFNTRWWDYSEKKFNINGRICLENLVPFGIGCLLVVYFINPFLTRYINMLSDNLIQNIAIILIIIFIIDFIVSFKIIWNFKKVARNVRKDNTEKVTSYVRKEILNLHKKLYTRIVEAFPKFEVTKIFNKKSKK